MTLAVTSSSPCVLFPAGFADTLLVADRTLLTSFGILTFVSSEITLPDESIIGSVASSRDEKSSVCSSLPGAAARYTWIFPMANSCNKTK